MSLSPDAQQQLVNCDETHAHTHNKNNVPIFYKTVQKDEFIKDFHVERM